MNLTRQMRVVGGPEIVRPRITVAFASSDGHVVDEHFGYARSVIVYSVSKTTANVVRIGEFATTEGEARGRLGAKLVWLGNCSVVYAAAIGSSASAQLMARGVLPLRTTPGTPIRDLVELVQEEMNEGVAQWLSQITKLKWQAIRRTETFVSLIEQE
jgi:nitrogen fixation protein NifX